MHRTIDTAHLKCARLSLKLNDIRQQNGTGLGLHVNRKLAQMAQAKISLESELGKGLIFTIYFPNLK